MMHIGALCNALLVICGDGRYQESNGGSRFERRLAAQVVGLARGDIVRASVDKAPILVTGAGGFVGRWLLPALRAAIPDVPVLISEMRPRLGQNVVMDIINAAQVNEVIKTYQPQAVINLAGLSYVPDAEAAPRVAYEINLFGVMNLAQAILTHTPDCRFVFVGSSEVYGSSFIDAVLPLDEDALLAPRNIYASTKAAADLLMGQMAYKGLQVVRFRPFNHIGIGQSKNFVVPAFVSQIVDIEMGNKPPIISVGNLNAYRDFLDVRDVVSAYVAAVTPSVTLLPGTVMNLASGKPHKIGDLLKQLCDMSSKQIEIEIDAERLRDVEIPFAVGNPSRARELLCWDKTIPVEQTLFEVLEDARKKASSSR